MTLTVQRAKRSLPHRRSTGSTRSTRFNFGGHYRAGDTRPRPAARQQRRHGGAPAAASARTATATWRSSPGCCRARWSTTTARATTACCIPGSPNACRPAAASATARRTPATASPCTSCRCGCCPTPPASSPGYEQRDINDALAGGGLVPIASGKGHDGAVTIHQRDAVLWGGRLPAGATVERAERRARARLRRRSATGRLDDGTALGTGDGVRDHRPQHAALHRRT